MTSHPSPCEYCGDVWTNPIAAALCCDPAAHGDAD